MRNLLKNLFGKSERLSTPLQAPYQQNEQGSTRLALDPMIFIAFPRTISWKGEQLHMKDELHATIMHPKSLPELAEVQNDRFASFLASFVQKNPVRLSAFLNDFRCASEEGPSISVGAGNRTIVVRCTLSNLPELFSRFNKEFKVNLPLQAAHVTLYTLQKNRGIYINDEKTMETLERVHLPELEAALRNTHVT